MLMRISMLSPFFDRCNVKLVKKLAAVLSDHAENPLDTGSAANCL